jgi:hypothetical protein
VDANTSALDALEASLRSFDGIGVAIAKDALPAVEAAARSTAEAGTDPSGVAWAPTKDGRAALPNAAAVLRAVVSGTTQALITLVMPRAYQFHQASKNRSAKRGLPRRVILPNVDTGIPDGIRDALLASAARVAGRVLGGSK